MWIKYWISLLLGIRFPRLCLLFMKQIIRCSPLFTSLLSLLLCCYTPVLIAQTINPFDVLKGLSGGSNKLTNWLRNEPITTSVKDVKTYVDLPDEFGNDRKPYGLHRQPRTETGGYWLEPGFYEMRTQSFCIKAGTHAPSNGDGYLYAPLAGRQSDVFEHILKTWQYKPGIQQHEVQVLLWALIAKADFNQMNAAIQRTAVQLLTPAQLARISRASLMKGALQLANFRDMPQEIRFVLEAEAKLRQAFSSATASYQDMERMAMLAGAAFVDNPQIRRGHWSKHPEGYYVRYMPNGYSQTVVQVYVPETVSRVEFDAVNDVAVPMNTGAQRLAQSNIPYDTTGYAQKPQMTPPVVVASAPPVVTSTPPTAPPPASKPVVLYQDVCVKIISLANKTPLTGATVRIDGQLYSSDAKGEVSLKKQVVGSEVTIDVQDEGFVGRTVAVKVAQMLTCQWVAIGLTAMEPKPVIVASAPPKPTPEPVPPAPTKPVAVEPTPASTTASGGFDPNTDAKKAGEAIVLKNIQFDQSKSNLLDPGKAELDRVVDWLKKNLAVVIELSGHTTNEGSRLNNVRLSQERVAECKAYLVSQGIDGKRIKTVGYGPDRPLVSQNSPDKAINRRVEMRIL